MNTNERFFKYVNKTETCWLWTGSQNGNGYGRFWDGKRVIPAHWFLLSKRPTAGKEACHICDVRNCVRPTHIFIGTRSENVKDCVFKGRYNRENSVRNCAAMRRKRNQLGTKNSQSKLTEEQAAKAAACPTKRGFAAQLAREFGVTVSVITRIRDGKSWPHIKPQLKELP